MRRTRFLMEHDNNRRLLHRYDDNIQEMEMRKRRIRGRRSPATINGNYCVYILRDSQENNQHLYEISIVIPETSAAVHSVIDSWPSSNIIPNYFDHRGCGPLIMNQLLIYYLLKVRK